MKCTYCKEDIIVGEACIVEASDERHAKFYHPECHVYMRAEEQEKRIQYEANCARVGQIIGRK